ncbi:MAG: MBL fold metallo-hydrolase, partial [Longimicrobiales bacterium]
TLTWPAVLPAADRLADPGTVAGSGFLAGSGALAAQAPDGEVARHVDAAREAAGDQHGALFNLICPLPEGPEGEALQMDAAPTELPSIPGEEEWRTEPVQVFDNLYYVGQSAYSAWAIDTSEGIIVIDAIFDYSVEAQIADGLRELGLDPNDIRYVIVSHAHGDHVGGAAYLQEEFGARVVLAEADWELINRSDADWPKPTRDIVAENGQTIELGDVTVTLFVTPGHTPGTLSTVVTGIREGDDTHVAASWGGTAFNFRGTEEFPRDYWLDAYAESAEGFREVVREAAADVLIANHPRFDGTTEKIPALRDRDSTIPTPTSSGRSGWPII